MNDLSGEGANVVGVAVAGLSVVSSGMQQILCRTLQQKHGLTSHELLSNTAPAQARQRGDGWGWWGLWAPTLRPARRLGCPPAAWPAARGCPPAARGAHPPPPPPPLQAATLLLVGPFLDHVVTKAWVFAYPWAPAAAATLALSCACAVGVNELNKPKRRVLLFVNGCHSQCSLCSKLTAF